MKHVLVPALALLLVGGCPNLERLQNSFTVTAVIGYSSTTGSAPFSIVLTAADSTSRNGGTLTYQWDLGDGTTSEEVSLTHRYESPGLYRVILRVIDETGAVGAESIDVRVSGGEAIAIIAASVTSGEAPLPVQFDATESIAIDDTIRDYFWDFNDGSTSSQSAPLHVFEAEGEYTVTLRVVTAGGTEATTSTVISVASGTASLQFDGSSRATLPLGSWQTLPECTFEAWVRMESEGGNIATIGHGAMTVEIVPSTNTVRTRIYGVEATGTASGLASAWRHIAVVYNKPDEAGAGGEGSTPNPGDGLCTVYLDGAIVFTTAVTDDIVGDTITIGTGMRGRVGEVRFWNTARTLAEVNAGRGQRITDGGSDAIGIWPMEEGTGQTLRDLANPSLNGWLGSAAAADDSDPAWSTDGPPL